jgi:thiamine-monophosphate kinase
MATDESPDTLAGLGEFAVIDRLVTGRDQPPEVALGPGDDAAVVSAADGRTVVSTDMLVADRHFRLDWSTPHDVGRKAIAQNAADIESMGARATAFVVAFGAPGDTPAEQTLELADGMWHEARLLGAGIVGGDLVSAPWSAISVTPRPDSHCGTTVFTSSRHCAVATSFPNLPTVRAASRPTVAPPR